MISCNIIYGMNSIILFYTISNGFWQFTLYKLLLNGFEIVLSHSNKKNEELKNTRPRIRIFLHLHDVDAIPMVYIYMYMNLSNSDFYNNLECRITCR